jgi:hypothetical protein
MNSDKITPANAAPRCNYLKLNGSRCGAPALRGRRLCYFHLRALRPRRDYRLPVIDDAASLQYAIMQVLRALEDKYYDARTSAIMLYGLQIACSNLNRYTASQPQPESQEDSLAGILLGRLQEMQDKWRREGDRDPNPGCPTLSPGVGEGWDKPNPGDPGDQRYGISPLFGRCKCRVFKDRHIFSVNGVGRQFTPLPAARSVVARRCAGGAARG